MTLVWRNTVFLM